MRPILAIVAIVAVLCPTLSFADGLSDHPSATRVITPLSIKKILATLQKPKLHMTPSLGGTLADGADDSCLYKRCASDPECFLFCDDTSYCDCSTTECQCR